MIAGSSCSYRRVHDKAALAPLRMLYSERVIVDLPAHEMLLGGGNIHCITQQQPAPKYREAPCE